MIDTALEFLNSQVNDYLTLKGMTLNQLALGNLAEEAGGGESTNALIMSMVKMEEDRILKDPRAFRENANGTKEVVNPEIRLYLYILIAARFKDASYSTGLSYLSHVVQFFQGRNVFAVEQYPAMGTLKKLIVELQQLTFEQQNNLWSATGAKYVPSALYRVQLVSIREDVVLQAPSEVSAFNFSNQLS